MHALVLGVLAVGVAVPVRAADRNPMPNPHPDVSYNAKWVCFNWPAWPETTAGSSPLTGLSTWLPRP